MRLFLISLAAVVAAAHGAHAQAIVLPANADLRAMQAPADWEGSRSQRAQEGDPDAARWSASAEVPKAEPRVAAPSPADATLTARNTPEFRVDVSDSQGHVVETVAHCSSLSICRAAYKQAAKDKRGQKVTLRQDTLVVASREANAKSNAKSNAK